MQAISLPCRRAPRTDCGAWSATLIGGHDLAWLRRWACAGQSPRGAAFNTYALENALAFSALDAGYSRRALPSRARRGPRASPANRIFDSRLLGAHETQAPHKHACCRKERHAGCALQLRHGMKASFTTCPGGELRSSYENLGAVVAAMRMG